MCRSVPGVLLQLNIPDSNSVSVASRIDTSQFTGESGPTTGSATLEIYDVDGFDVC